jgi:hypothetical protein
VVAEVPVVDAVATPNPNFTNPPVPEVPSVLPLLPLLPLLPITPDTPTRPPLLPLPPTQWGQVGAVNLPGLNPGFITNVPRQYQTTSPVQSQFSWGRRPYQPGPTFNRDLYRQVAAPAVPFGLQQMYTPMNINRYVAEQAARTQQAIAPAPAPGPVKPA